MESSLGRALRRRKLLILFIALAAVGASRFLDRLHPPSYVATALVSVANGERAPLSPLQPLLPPPPAPEARTPAVVRRAAGLLGWIRAGTPEAESARLVQAILGQLTAERTPAGDIRVSVRDENPARAVAMANAVARAYVQTEQDNGVNGQGGGEKAVLLELRKAEDSLEGAESRMKGYLMRFGDGQSPTADELDALRNLLKGLIKVYTPKHPEVVTTRIKIKALEERLKKETDREAERQRLLRDMRIAEDNVAFLSRRHKESLLSSGGKVAAMASPAQIPDRADAAQDRKLLWQALGAGLVLGLGLALILEAGRGAPADAQPSSDKASDLPVLAAIPAVARGAFSLFSRAKPVEKIRRELIFIHPPESPLVESYRTLRANLRLPTRPGGRPAPLLGITSPTPTLRKGLVALNLCLMTARAGLRTLLIEGDIRYPLIHWLLGLPGEPGLADAAVGSLDWTRAVRGTSDFLFGGLKLDALLKTPGIENFRFLPGGTLSAAASDILGAPQLDRVLRETRAQFDLVVVNCPAFGPNADALQLVPKTDATVFVYDGSDAGALARAKDQMQNVKTRISGLILVEG